MVAGMRGGHISIVGMVVTDMVVAGIGSGSHDRGSHDR